MSKHLQDFPISAGDAPECRPASAASKFCRDCSHHRAHPQALDDPEMALCGLKTRTSLVSGVVRAVYCENERSGDCGKDAKFFDPITVTMAAE